MMSFISAEYLTITNYENNFPNATWVDYKCVDFRLYILFRQH